MSLENIKQEHATKLKHLKETESRSSSNNKRRAVVVVDRNVLLNDLKNHILDITFIKLDGSERTIKCTLIPSYLPTKVPEEDISLSRDYTRMDIEEMYRFCGDRPDRWAAAMEANPPDLQKISLKSWIEQWLPHVIEASVGVRRQQLDSPRITVWDVSGGWRSFYLDKVINVQIATPT